MRLWIDILDGSNNRLGDGPIWTLKQGQVKRALDGAGSLRATLVASDPRAVALAQVGRVLQLWGEDPGGVRLLGEGIIANIRVSDDPTGVSLILDGPDVLEELKRKNTLLGRVYNQERLADVCDDLIGLVPGWSVVVDSSIASQLVDARFDGMKVLAAFQEIAKRYGHHLRASQQSSRTLEIGPFGAASGLRAQKVETINPEALRNPDLLMVQRIQRDTVRESNNFYNVLVPLGAGEGTAALTLEKSTRNTPYPIQTLTGPDGRTLHYLATTNYPSGGYTDFRTDPEAVVRVGQFKEVAPLSNSEPDIVNAANALYDAAAAELERASVVQEIYGLTVVNVRENIQPGDTVAIDYIGQVLTNGQPLTYLAVRGDFYVLGATERVTLEGRDVQLQISNVDKFPQTEAELMFDTVEQMRLRNLKPNITGGPPATYVFDRELAPSFPADVPIEITDAVTELLRARLRIRTSPFRSTVSTAVTASGGGVATTSGGGGGGTSTSEIQDQPGGLPVVTGPEHQNTGTIFHNHVVGDHRHGVTLPSHTHSVTIPSHTHDVTITYAIADDTETPEGITVWFQSEDVTEALFGAASLAPTGGAINQVADAGALADLLRNASGGLRQLHTLEIQCTGGQGRVEVIVELFQTTQTILRAGS